MQPQQRATSSARSDDGPDVLPDMSISDLLPSCARHFAIEPLTKCEPTRGNAASPAAANAIGATDVGDGGGGFRKEGKQFFFEKKNQKTFGHWSRASRTVGSNE
jgi:hypothetical protein